jgi:hypothetical protein
MPSPHTGDGVILIIYKTITTLSSMSRVVPLRFELRLKPCKGLVLNHYTMGLLGCLEGIEPLIVRTTTECFTTKL